MSVTNLIVEAPSPNHIRTYTGGWINPVDPDKNDIDILDIAHSLAHQCRFTGHVSTFYSVAEHSCRVADFLYEKWGAQDAYYGLLHDASEAYVSDLARPVKRNEAISDAYDKIENNLMGFIAEKFNFPWPMTPNVKYADDVLLRTEQRDLMQGATYPGEVLLIPLKPWTPTDAKYAFLDRFAEYQELMN